MSSERFLEGKRILFTNHSLASFGGAELNSVELAEQLIKFGAKPYFFSYDAEGPLAEYINVKFDTEVITDNVNALAENENQKELGNTALNINDYDYIWVSANMIPISIIKQINIAKKLPKFIFIHMSPLVAFPMDAPLLPTFEKKVASRILSISENTTENAIYRILDRDIPLEKWYNPAPAEFRKLNNRKGELRTIAVISSSHPTEEVMRINDELKKRGIQVDYVGRFNNNMQVVDAHFYDKYDLVIGIGKNVKYSLVSGVPIYIYGRFGGCGYLNNNNYNTASKFNFSGRGFTKKTKDAIVSEILKGYNDALRFHEERRDQFVHEFSLDIIAEKLFRALEEESAKKIKLPDNEVNWLVSTQINLMQRMQCVKTNRNLERHIQYIEDKLRDTECELANVYKSHSWKATRPLRGVAGIVKKAARRGSKKGYRNSL